MSVEERQPLLQFAENAAAAGVEEVLLVQGEDGIAPLSVVSNAAGSKRSRLRKKVRSLLSAHHLVSGLRENLRVPGAPPGVDVKIPHPALEAIFNDTCTITVSDYSADKCHTQDVPSGELEDFLHAEQPSWAKVRWIDIRGVNYGTVRVLAQRYKLHPLAIEDVFHIPQAVKADWYESHIYASMTVTTLENPLNDDGLDPKDTASEDSSVTSIEVSPSGIRRSKRTRMFPNRLKARLPYIIPHPDIAVEQANFFLTKGGVVISIFQYEGDKITDSIYKRLERPDDTRTLLRESEDPSFLLFSLIDLVTDHFFPIVEAYRLQLDTLEAFVFQNPRAEATQELYVMAKELGSLRRALVPIKNMVTSLRENGKYFSIAQNSIQPPPIPTVTSLTKTYLSDVKDHADMLLDSLESFEADCMRLVDLIFNLISHSTNESMKTLAVVSLIFLPISFLAGVFGMNFDFFPELRWSWGVYAFWMMVLGIVIFCVICFRMMGWIGPRRKAQ